MIQYTLQCESGHRFDAWFRNASAYDEQQARGIVVCAVCGSGGVEKAPMAPAVARSDVAGRGDDQRVPLASSSPEALKFRELLRQYRRKVVEEADYVGDRFAEEARKIHFEEAEGRGIYGEATRDEVAALIEDGVDFLPLPDVPEDHN